MRRLKTLALMITLCLVMCSCTGSSESTHEAALDIRAYYLGAEKMNASINITAESSDRLYDFTVHFSGDENNCRIDVLKPDVIAGMSAVISNGKVSIENGAAVFDIGRTFSDAVSPLETVPTLIGAWKNERIDASYAEKLDGILYTVIESAAGGGGCTQKTWFGSDMLPVYSEIFSGAERIISCRFDTAELIMGK